MVCSYLHQDDQIFRVAASAPDCFGSVVPALARVVGGRFPTFQCPTPVTKVGS